jgi:alkylation response protein AidB-like acyl-CoA dehydrogenase
MTTEAAMRIDPEEMREAAVRLLADKVDRRAPWEGRGNGLDALEGEMSELGWYLLTAPEACGGLGQGFEALAPLYEEMGKALAPVWLSGTMAAVDVLVQDGSAEAMAAVSGIAAEGWRVATSIIPAGQSLQAAVLPMVGGADSATHLLLIAEDGSGARFLPVDAPGVTITPVSTWDMGRGYAEIALALTDGAGIALDPVQILDCARAHLELALAWDCIGGASRNLAETVEYMLGRQQFGRPVASFQALKHRAADHKVAIELARSLVAHASTVYAGRGEGWATLAAQARILAGEAYAAVAEDSVQLHGGVGFTWEYSCHLFLKRALANQILGGSPDALRDRVAPEVARRALATMP